MPSQSRREGQFGDFVELIAELDAVTELVPLWALDIHDSYKGDAWIAELKEKISKSDSANNDSKLTLHQEVVRYKGIICVGSNGDWRNSILKEMHDSALGGHSGITATYQRIKRSIYWAKLKEDVHRFIRTCDNCQLNKSENWPTPGLLQPLPIPNEAWSSVGMDFLTGLPKSEGKEVIMLVVDRLTKYAHFIALSHPDKAIDVAQAFLDHIYKHHGLPLNIVTDRDPIFTSRFWKELMAK